MRAMFTLAILATLAAPVFAQSQEAQTHRFGSTYSTPQASSASSCSALCSGDTRCMAWTYIKPVATSTNRCELKLSEGVAEHNPIAISGLSPRSPLAKIKADIALRRSEPALASPPPLPKYYKSAFQDLRVYSRPAPVRAAAPAPTRKPATPGTSRVISVGKAPIISTTSGKAKAIMGAPKTSPYITRTPQIATPPRPMPKPLKPQRQPDTTKALEVLNSVPVALAPSRPVPPQARPAPQTVSAPAPRTVAPTPTPAPQVRYATPPAVYPVTKTPAPVAASASPPAPQPIVRLGTAPAPAPEVVSPYYNGRSTVTATPPPPVTLGAGNVEISPPPPAAKPSTKTPAGTRVIPSDPDIISQYYQSPQTAPVAKTVAEPKADTAPASSLLRGALKP